MIWWFFACAAGPLAPTEPGPEFEGRPQITQVQWGCDVENSQWYFLIDTHQWSGGGRVWMGRSSTNNESHSIASVEAAGDGSFDKLKLYLTVASDWRLANSGSSSRYPCADQWDLNYIVTVQNTQKDTTTDCRIWGAETTMWNRVDVAPTCENTLPWDPPVDTGEAQP